MPWKIKHLTGNGANKAECPVLNVKKPDPDDYVLVSVLWYSRKDRCM